MTISADSAYLLVVLAGLLFDFATYRGWLSVLVHICSLQTYDRASGRRRKVSRKVWSQRLPFKCKETALCGISMLALLFFCPPSLSLPLQQSPVTPLLPHRPPCLRSFSFTPSLLITCHPLPPSPPTPSPLLRPSVVIFLPFKFTPQEFPLVGPLLQPLWGWGGYRGDN